MPKIYPQRTYFKFYTERLEDGSAGKLRWTTLHIHQLDTILELLPLKDILASEFDNRKSNIDQLSKDQLKKECSNLGLDNSGKKVNFQLLFVAISHTVMSVGMFTFPLIFSSSLSIMINTFISMTLIYYKQKTM